jgi:hypothetical protein
MIVAQSLGDAKQVFSYQTLAEIHEFLIIEPIMSATAASLANNLYLSQTGDRLVLNDLVEHLLSTLSGTIRRIVLFGSRARGDFDLSSDMDVLVVTKECDSSVLELARTARYEVMQSWQFEPLISMLLLSEQDYEDLARRSAGLKANIEREGLVIWPNRCEVSPNAASMCPCSAYGCSQIGPVAENRTDLGGASTASFKPVFLQPVQQCMPRQAQEAGGLAFVALGHL